MKNNTSPNQNSQSQNPAPSPGPAKPKRKILDDFPEIMKRPLRLINGKGYAATWIPVSMTVTETEDKNGNIVQHDPPIVNHFEQLVIVREDGKTEWVNQENALGKLGFEVSLPEKPPKDKLWGSRSLMDFEKGIRPVPKDVFTKIKDVIIHFIDFDHSLSDQDTMVEFIACFILTTWFLDAFQVIGFLWPNGERGSGKTNLLLIVAELSYLGQVILAGGSFPSIRDMADYGSTLAFDDAESLADPKTSDPDKRALLLAGNRKGITVPLKEPDGKGKWKTRHVDAYCPRVFSAIHLPDSVLASRSIIVPLIRTTDQTRGNQDPTDYGLWPHKRKEIIDDLWATAVGYLSEMRQYDAEVGKNTSLTGRALQPWRAVLAVAAWLDNHGVTGILQRMDKLSQDYQKERHEFEVSDFTSLVVHALLESANSAIGSISANNNQNPSFEFQTTDVTNKAKGLAKKDDWDIDEDYIQPRRVGRVISKLRLEESPRPGGKGSRRRKAKLSDLVRLAAAYNVPLPQQLSQFITNNQTPSTTNTNGSAGTNGSNGPVPTAQQISLEDLANRLSSLDTTQPCPACHTTNWSQHPNGGGYFCATCHPINYKEHQI